MSTFRSEYTHEDRCYESEKMLSRYPDKIPVVCEISPNDNIKCSRMKYVVPRNLTIGQLSYYIRKRFELPPEKAMFIMINKVIPPTAALLSDIYNKYKGSDNFLVLGIHFENFFG